jgi:peroxiredoxin
METLRKNMPCAPGALLAFVFVVILLAPPAAAVEIDMPPNTKAPGFVLKNMDGEHVSLAALRGKVVLLNFWATWCRPCKEEMPAFEKLYAKYKDRGFVVLAVSINRSKTSITGFLEDMDLSYHILMDDDSRVLKLYKVYSIPTTFLIDKTGLIVKKYHGQEDWTSTEMASTIEELLK